MQLITILSAATAMVVGVSASASSSRNANTLNKECNKSAAHAKIVNRCDYPVYLWSVFKGNGCPSDAMLTLNKGESYYENYADADGGLTGVSIKISKEKQCKPNDIVQLEYYLEKGPNTAFNFNYLDVSYVDCLGNDCPTKSEGYYLVAGDQKGKNTASASNTWCPILSCTDAASCAKMSYILPDDVQTKTCDLDQSMVFYMCGGNAPDGDSYDTVSSSSSKKVESATSKAASSTSTSTKTPTPTSTKAAASYGSGDSISIKIPAVTPTPLESLSAHKTKTQVVYVTAYETVKAKRRDHGHARRHQPFHA